MKQRKNLCIIPARRNSKRIPLKNIKEFHGRPIIEYVIGTCLNSNIFDEVVVSTDCKHIASIAQKAGASVPFIRPADLSDDLTPTINVVQHALSFYQDSGVEFRTVCCVYATAPFLTSAVLLKGLKRLNEEQCNFVFAGGLFSNPVLRAVAEDGQMLFPQYKKTRSQDLTSYYYDAGQFYWGTRKAFETNSSILGNKAIPLKIDQKLAIDIDNLDDWKEAELVWEKITKKETLF